MIWLILIVVAYCLWPGSIKEPEGFLNLPLVN